MVENIEIDWLIFFVPACIEGLWAMTAASLFLGCRFGVELNLRDRPGHERGARCGINVVRDV
jgi:hypothetical protein